MARGRAASAILVALLSIVGAAGCGGPMGSAGLGAGAPALLPAPSEPAVDLSTAPTRVHVDRATATAAWIGPAGGTVSAKAAEVPAISGAGGRVGTGEGAGDR